MSVLHTLTWLGTFLFWESRQSELDELGDVSNCKTCFSSVEKFSPKYFIPSFVFFDSERVTQFLL